jgi:hypothetical protein
MTLSPCDRQWTFCALLILFWESSQKSDPQFIWTHSLVCLFFIFWVFLPLSMKLHSFYVLYRGYDDPFPRLSKMKILSTIFRFWENQARSLVLGMLFLLRFSLILSFYGHILLSACLFFRCSCLFLWGHIILMFHIEDMMTLSPDDRKWTYWALYFSFEKTKPEIWSSKCYLMFLLGLLLSSDPSPIVSLLPLQCVVILAFCCFIQ